MKLLSCIAFHFAPTPEKLENLRRVVLAHVRMADAAHIVITTNTDKAEDLAQFMAVAPPESTNCKFTVHPFPDLPNPWLLPWAHKVIMLRHFYDESYSHFLYSEDDLEMSQQNMAYWLAAREVLRPFGLYPGFFRVEWKADYGEWVSSDIHSPMSLAEAPKIEVNDSLAYVNPSRPYQGMFLYDRELMKEHIASPSFDLMRYGHIELLNTSWGGGVAERANLGLTRQNIPPNFLCRIALPVYTKYLAIDPCCFIHHLPNNYANNAGTTAGKLRVRDVLHP